MPTLGQRLSDLRTRIKDTIDEQKAQAQALVRTDPAPLEGAGPEPPVVARLMVEIRSDGSTTVARGAIEDIASGERVAVEARGTTPAQLAGSLAKTIFATPLLARAAVKAVLDARKPRPPDDGEPE
ncbi:MAG TPA: hypothetical protein VHE30_17605 [Polyangiaceae bacterium]|nr:hypothetical protein [Polyangiaceae bacterium]